MVTVDDVKNHGCQPSRWRALTQLQLAGGRVRFVVQHCLQGQPLLYIRRSVSGWITDAASCRSEGLILACFGPAAFCAARLSANCSCIHCPANLNSCIMSMNSLSVRALGISGLKVRLQATNRLGAEYLIFRPASFPLPEPTKALWWSKFLLRLGHNQTSSQQCPRSHEPDSLVVLLLLDQSLQTARQALNSGPMGVSRPTRRFG